MLSLIFSAYCGGLWLGALYCMIKMAECLEKSDDQKYYMQLFEKGKAAYENLLWNGSYYNFDESTNESKSIMADQLCVHWYLRCCGVKNYPVSKLNWQWEVGVADFKNKFCFGFLTPNQHA